MASSNVVAVILPTTAHILKLKHPPVKRMLEEGVIVALGTDFNPNAYCTSMLTVMNLACIMFRMSMEESLVAATLNAAASIGKSDLYGSIEVGKWGDLVLFDAPRWEHIIYQMNASEIISHVIKKGKIVFRK
jgi:imidazolonepropionase